MDDDINQRIKVERLRWKNATGVLYNHKYDNEFKESFIGQSSLYRMKHLTTKKQHT